MRLELPEALSSAKGVRVRARSGHLAQAASMLRQTARAWTQHRAASMGAALAFYTLFSIAPILIIASWIAGTVLAPQSVQSHLLAEVHDLMGDAVAGAVRTLLAQINQLGRSGFNNLVGIVTMIIGATSVFGELQRDLDRVWNSPAAAAMRGIWPRVCNRLLSFGLILGAGFLLLLFLIVSAALSAVRHWLAPFTDQWQMLLMVLDPVLSLAAAAALFALIYKVVPREAVAWGDVWIGAAGTSLLFYFGKLCIGIYLSRSMVVSAYGAASSFLVLLLWIYYSAQIFLFGAEFTRIYAYQHGSRAGRPLDPP